MAGFNWHTVAGYGVLLVECKGCGRRGAIDKEGARRRMQGNMGEINRKKFRCRKCGGTEVRAYLPTTKDQVEMFLAGDPAGTMRQVN